MKGPVAVQAKSQERVGWLETQVELYDSLQKHYMPEAQPGYKRLGAFPPHIGSLRAGLQTG